MAFNKYIDKYDHVDSKKLSQILSISVFRYFQKYARKLPYNFMRSSFSVDIFFADIN